MNSEINKLTRKIFLWSKFKALNRKQVDYVAIFQTETKT